MRTRLVSLLAIVLGAGTAMAALPTSAPRATADPSPLPLPDPSPSPLACVFVSDLYVNPTVSDLAGREGIPGNTKICSPSN